MFVDLTWFANAITLGDGTPRKLATATQPQICAAPFSNMCSTQADKNSQKLRLPVSLMCPRP
jgi:hypothetical protein